MVKNNGMMRTNQVALAQSLHAEAKRMTAEYNRRAKIWNDDPNPANMDEYYELVELQRQIIAKRQEAWTNDAD